jgi:hypothetical protein
MTLTEQALNVIADMTARMCELRVDGQVAHDRDAAPGLFRALLEAWHDIPGSERLGIDATEAIEAQMTLAKMKAMAHLADPVRTHPPPAAQTCGTCRHWHQPAGSRVTGYCGETDSPGGKTRASYTCPKWAAKDCEKMG